MTIFNYFLNGSVKALRLNATINQLSLTFENIGEDVNSSFYHLRTNIKCTIMLFSSMKSEKPFHRELKARSIVSERRNSSKRF